jgi:hypothetical protein
LIGLGVDIRNPNINDAVRALRPKATNQDVTTVLFAIIVAKQEEFFIFFFVRVHFQAATGVEFGFVANWALEAGSNSSRISL